MGFRRPFRTVGPPGWRCCGLAARSRPGVPGPFGIIGTRRMGVVPTAGGPGLQLALGSQAGGGSPEAIGRLARPLRCGSQGGDHRGFIARHPSPSSLTPLRPDGHQALGLAVSPSGSRFRRRQSRNGLNGEGVVPPFCAGWIGAYATQTHQSAWIVRLGGRSRSFSPRRTQQKLLQFRYDIDVLEKRRCSWEGVTWQATEHGTTPCIFLLPRYAFFNRKISLDQLSHPGQQVSRVVERDMFPTASC